MIRVWPLDWPRDRSRTVDRLDAKFRDGREGRRLSLDMAIGRLRSELDRLGALYPSVSTNVRFNRDGTRDATSRGSEDQADPGAVARFRLDGRDYELACDKWDRVADNVAAIAAHIDALRGQERWGVADLKQAFAGHVALPAPTPWHEVLGVTPTAPIGVVTAAYRALARLAHPDAGGARENWDRLNAAYDAAKKERG